MALLSLFTHSIDRRWQGPQRIAPILLLPITSFVILILIAFLTAVGYAVSHLNDYDADSWKYNGTAYNLFVRGLWALIFEAIHLPLHLTLFLTSRLYPVTALVFSFISFGVWVTSATITLIIEWSDIWPSGAYAALITWDVVMQWLLVLLYAIHMGYAAKAVHVWRMEKRRNFKIKDVEMPRID